MIDFYSAGISRRDDAFQDAGIIIFDAYAT